MAATFQIDVDPTNNIVRYYLSGFFEPEDIKRFVAAQNAAYSQLTCPPNQHVTLVDVRDMKIQQQDVVQAFGAMLDDPSQRSRKLAFVFALSLAKMQLLRAAESREARYFSDMAEAEAWLVADDDEIVTG